MAIRGFLTRHERQSPGLPSRGSYLAAAAPIDNWF